MASKPSTSKKSDFNKMIKLLGLTKSEVADMLGLTKRDTSGVKRNMAKGGTPKKKKGMARGGMKKKGMARGGMKKKGMAKGGMKKKGYSKGGLKPAPNKGAASLPKAVRNKMGFMKKGGMTKKKGMARGGMKKKGYAKGGAAKRSKK